MLYSLTFDKLNQFLTSHDIWNTFSWANRSSKIHFLKICTWWPLVPSTPDFKLFEIILNYYHFTLIFACKLTFLKSNHHTCCCNNLCHQMYFKPCVADFLNLQTVYFRLQLSCTFQGAFMHWFKAYLPGHFIVKLCINQVHAFQIIRHWIMKILDFRVQLQFTCKIQDKSSHWV